MATREFSPLVRAPNESTFIPARPNRHRLSNARGREPALVIIEVQTGDYVEERRQSCGSTMRTGERSEDGRLFFRPRPAITRR